MIKMVFMGMKRRNKEIRYVAIVTFIAVLFMTGITLFQNMMDSYVYTKNLYNYGDWVVSSLGTKLEHPYFQKESTCTVGDCLVDEKGERNMIYMGKADENFFSTYDELFYEGRMPKAEDEIVMDIVALSILGYSYDLDQTIEIHYLKENGSLIAKEYRLVGVIKNFAEMWKKPDGTKLPNMFVCESEFQKNAISANTIYFYQLMSIYNEINTGEFANSFMDKDAVPNPIAYNTYVYENRLWGSPEVFEKVSMVLMLLSAIAISYFMLVYTGKRRNVFYQYRCVGASKMQVRAIILFECLYCTLLPAITAIATAYVIAWAIGGYFEKEMINEKVYQFDASLCLTHILLSLGVILFSVLVTQFSVNERRLAGNTKEVKPSQYKKLSKQSKKTKYPEKSLIKRENAIRPGQAFASTLFTVIVIGCLVLCVYKISYSIEKNLSLLDGEDCSMWYDDEETYDFQVEVPKEDGMIHVYTHNAKPSAVYYGVDYEFIEMLERVPGISGVEYYWTDEMHYLTWDGMENSQVMKHILENCYLETPFEYEEGMVFYNDDQLNELKKSVFEKGETESINWDAIKNGEEVIIIYEDTVEVGEYSDGEYSEIEYITVEENTLNAGDMVSITHSLENTTFPVKVAAVYAQSDFDTYRLILKNSELVTRSYTLIGSKVLAEKIAVSEGKELKYNTIELVYDSISSFESTDKQIASIATNNGMGYRSSAEFKRISAQQMIQDVGIYGSIFIMIFVVYVIQQKLFLSGKMKYRKQQYITLKRIGMEDKQYCRCTFIEEIKQYVWMFFGMLPGYVLIGYSEYMYQLKFLEQLGETTFDFIDMIKTTIIPSIRCANHVVLIAMIAVIYVIMLLASGRTIQKFIKEEK